MRMDSSEISNSSSRMDGGALDISDHSIALLNSSTVKQTRRRSAINCHGNSKVNLNSFLITLNQDGGIDSKDCRLTVESCNFTNNIRDSNIMCGSAIRTVKSIVTVDGCHFNNNSAVNKGSGAILASKSTVIDIHNTVGSNNTGADEGAGFLTLTETSNLTCSNVELCGNKIRVPYSTPFFSAKYVVLEKKLNGRADDIDDIVITKGSTAKFKHTNIVRAGSRNSRIVISTGSYVTLSSLYFTTVANTNDSENSRIYSDNSSHITGLPKDKILVGIS